MQLSIIIPALNEQDYIQSTLNGIFKHKCRASLPEVIVIDNGSTDHTLQLVQSFQANLRILERPNLKGQKHAILQEGADQAKGDVLLFLDADTLLPLSYDVFIEEALQENQVVGGAFEFGFDQAKLPLQIITCLNRIRYRIWPRYFGDQAIFVTKQSLERCGGWPSKNIMEAAYLCDRLRKQGQLKLIPHKVRTSARRFQRGGIFKVFWFDLMIITRDLLGLEIEKFAGQYWANK